LRTVFCGEFLGPRRMRNSTMSFYRSLNVVRVIKSRRLRWLIYVTRMEEGRSGFKHLTGKSTGK
jgi:hypothetical protein